MQSSRLELEVFALALSRHRITSRSPVKEEPAVEPPKKSRKTMKDLLDEDTGVQSMYDAILERAKEAQRRLHSLEALEQIFTLAYECADGDARKVIGLVGALSFELHSSLAARPLLLTVARWTFMAGKLAGGQQANPFNIRGRGLFKLQRKSPAGLWALQA